MTYMSPRVRAERLRNAIHQMKCARVSVPWFAIEFDALSAKMRDELEPLDALIDEMEEV